MTGIITPTWTHIYTNPDVATNNNFILTINDLYKYTELYIMFYLHTAEDCYMTGIYDLTLLPKLYTVACFTYTNTNGNMGTKERSFMIEQDSIDFTREGMQKRQGATSHSERYDVLIPFKIFAR